MDFSDVKTRVGMVGGSDAKRILSGDWLELYNEKVGITPAEDLSRVFRVQLGVFTESFHRHWLCDVMGWEMTEISYRTHPDHPWMVAHTDSWLTKEDTFIELKHTSDWSSREAAEYYLPQIAHYCAVTARSVGYLSCIPGNGDPIVTKVEPPHDYIERLIVLETQFWWHVENRIAPDIIPKGMIAATNVIGEAVIVNNYRKVDMTGNNEWAALAADYLAHGEAAGKFDLAKAGLKKLVPKDASDCTGYGITISRNKAGSLLFKEAKAS